MVTLDANRVNVRHRLINTRSDTTNYGAFDQELPAIYTVGKLCNLYTYTGTQPFTGGAVTNIQNSGPPWANWTATENWSALINGSGWGLGVFNPGVYIFTGGFFGTPGTGGPADGNTGYIAPIGMEILDYNILYEYQYVLILGTLGDIRNYVYAHQPDPRPQQIFREDRQHFRYVNADDAGWPIPGCLRLDLSSSDPQIIGPSGLWNASDVPQLYIRAAFRAHDNHAELYFAPFGGGFSGDRRYLITTIPDGVVRTYTVNLPSNALYTGPIGQIRFDPVQSISAGDSADIYSITSAPPTPADFHISQQPSSQNVCLGATVTFTVAATGSGTLSYQWQKSGSNLANGGHYSGCTTATLTVSNCDSNDAATNYVCVVSSTNGSEKSKQATLSLNAVLITQQPLSKDVCPGATAIFTLAATGTGTLGYQWQKNGSNLTDGGHYSGVTTQTLTVSNTDLSDVAGYQCIITGCGGSTTSNGAALALKALVAITQQPASQTVKFGVRPTVTFSVVGTGYGSLKYQWQKNDVNLTSGVHYSGATTATLMVTDCASGDVGRYACLVTGDCSTILSDSAQLTLTQPGDFDLDGEVDQEDFGHFQACLKGSLIPQSDPGCQDARMDGDTDVDVDDLAIFLRCYSGPNVPADPNCAN